ncbi:MAG: RNA 2'-phosphotransferase [Proteobacteria bacterium]|nr:RNA 2'-phosphotransferase [Pseudomonadota bacterium]
MGPEKKHKAFTKLLEYCLGRNPYEFGLVPDQDGFVKTRELLKAINEENGFHHIRISHIHELTTTLSPPTLEIHESSIRAVNRELLPETKIPQELPKILYTCIREKAYPHVLEKGIQPSSSHKIILSDHRDMIERIGNRQGKHPVILHVNVAQAENAGVLFTQHGESIYLAKFIPPDCFSGPPISKQKKAAKPKSAPKKRQDHTLSETSDSDVSPGHTVSSTKARKDRESWKNNKKRIRRQKEKNWPHVN